MGKQRIIWLFSILLIGCAPAGAPLQSDESVLDLPGASDECAGENELIDMAREMVLNGHYEEFSDQLARVRTFPPMNDRDEIRDVVVYTGARDAADNHEAVVLLSDGLCSDYVPAGNLGWVASLWVDFDESFGPEATIVVGRDEKGTTCREIELYRYDVDEQWFTRDATSTELVGCPE